LEEKENSWKRMLFKKNKVWLHIGPDGEPVVKNQKVRIKYQLDQSHEYWVHPDSIRLLDSPEPEKTPPKKGPAGHKSPKTHKTGAETELMGTIPDGNTVHIYADGASSGNPGPAGIGVLFRFGSHEKEISRHIGIATNNIAELQAIKAGLSELKKRDIPVRVFTDSRYALGVLTLGWKAKTNQQLIESIKDLISTFKDLKVIKIKGHAGVEGNERADRLASSAAQQTV